MKSIFKIAVLPIVLVVTGCLSSEDSKDLLSELGPSTCISAEIYSFDGVVVTFSIPDVAIDFRISRDGASVFETADKTKTQIIDAELTPGQTYRYRCEVVVDRNTGYQKVGDEMTVTLPISTPPSFAGLTSATLTGSSTALLEWDLTEDSILSHYKIYKYLGTATDKSNFPIEPLAVVNDIFAVSSAVASLGDEITYSFRVVACNASDICDDNNEIKTVVTTDTGAPTTAGATGIVLSNGIVSLNVPWTDQNGNVSTRSIYRASTATGTACPAIFGLYGKVNDVVVTDPKDTPQQIDAAGVLSEGLKYCFVVRDMDPTGNINTNFNVQSVEIGDITNPDFIYPINLVRDPSNQEGGLVATWTAMTREIDDPLLGAHEYLVYISSVLDPGVPDADPCATGTLYETVSSVTYPQGSTVTLNISGLNPRNWHRVCVKAKDSSSNESTQVPTALASTGDTSAPNFSGIQTASFNNGTGEVEFSFIVPTDTDVRNYKVTIIRTRSGVTNTPIVITKTLGVLTPNTVESSSFTLAEADLGDNDIVSIRVDACDDANPNFNGADNCSATSAEQVLTLPDATPPQDFTGVAAAIRGSLHRSVEVSWGTPVSGWGDYAGFKVYYVDGGGNLVGLNSSDCLCTGNDCLTNPKTSCTVDREDGGALFTPSKQYEMYVAAFDIAGNQTTSYIAHSGGSKVTALSPAQDIVAPSFNASMVLSYAASGKVLFDKAIDDQDPSFEINYEIYRKENTTFTCPSTPYDAGGGCDGLAPMVTLAESALTIEGAKVFYLDNTVTDGVTYYYQLCALDNNSNRQCQVGAVGELIITDITPPVIANVDTTKAIGSGTNWTVSFDVSDNIVAADNLIIKVYENASAYPNPASPGFPAFETAGGTVVVAGSTASFDDTGVADIETTYYLILVQDLSGNKSYYEMRDMGPAPVITSVVWDNPIYPDGEPRGGTQAQLDDTDFRITIHGTNLENILTINDGTSPANQHDIKHCDTSRIISNTGTEVSCQTNNKIYYGIDYNLYIKDKYGRDITFNVGEPLKYCDYAAVSGITELRGLGTVSRPYVLCSPDHIKQIGLNVDNPNNTEDIVGYFDQNGDIDFAGVTDFTGIPVMQAGDFYYNGNYNFIKNLTIDTSATNVGAAFVLGCEGSQLIAVPFFQKVNFDNITIKTGAGRAAVGILEKNCDWPSAEDFMIGSTIDNSEIYANNTAGFWAAEYTTNQDDLASSYVKNSNLYSTRLDDTTAVGGFFGKLKGAATLTNPELDIHVDNVEFRPALGQTDSGYNIGGLVGEIDASNIVFNSWAVALVDIYGGLENIGGAVGQFRGGADDVTFQLGSVRALLIDDTGSMLNRRGGIVGNLIYIHNVEGVNNLTFDNVYVRDATINGEEYLGGFLGRMERTSNLNFVNGSYLRNTTITGTNYLGGLLGYSTKGSILIDDTHVGNSVDITINGNNYIGGFVGASSQTASTYTNSSVQRLTVNANSGSYVGGLAGQVNQMSTTVSQVGVGLTSLHGNQYVGGFFGDMRRPNLNMSDSYTNTDVEIYGASRTGGMVGNFDSDQTATIDFSRNASHAQVYSASSNVGNFFGYYFVSGTTTITFADNYYRNDWTGSNIVNDNVSYEVVGELEGKTQAELDVQATYVNWDFVNTWMMAPDHAKLQIFSGYGGL